MLLQTCGPYDVCFTRVFLDLDGQRWKAEEAMAFCSNILNELKCEAQVCNCVSSRPHELSNAALPDGIFDAPEAV